MFLTTSNWLNTFRDAAVPAPERPSPIEGFLTPGSYVAVLGSSPFMESALAGARSEDTAVVVYGISKPVNPEAALRRFQRISCQPSRLSLRESSAKGRLSLRESSAQCRLSLRESSAQRCLSLGETAAPRSRSERRP